MKRRQFLRAVGLAAAGTAVAKPALWWQVAELTYDSYLVRNRART
jgi:hypothetical protein